MGFYPPATLLRDGQRRGVECRPPDVDRARRRAPSRTAPRCGSASATCEVRRHAAERLVAERDAEGPVPRPGRPGAARAALRATSSRACSGPAPATPSTPTAAGSCGSCRCTAPRPEPARGRRSAGARARRLPHPGAAAHDRLGADGVRPRGHEPDHRPPPAGAPAAVAAAGITTSRPAARRAARAGHDRRHHHRPPAPGDGQGHRLPAGRGRARHDERDLPTCGLRARPDRDPGRAARAGVGPARAPRRQP